MFSIYIYLLPDLHYIKQNKNNSNKQKKSSGTLTSFSSTHVIQSSYIYIEEGHGLPLSCTRRKTWSHFAAFLFLTTRIHIDYCVLWHMPLIKHLLISIVHSITNTSTMLKTVNICSSSLPIFFFAFKKIGNCVIISLIQLLSNISPLKVNSNFKLRQHPNFFLSLLTQHKPISFYKSMDLFLGQF